VKEDAWLKLIISDCGRSVLFYVLVYIALCSRVPFVRYDIYMYLIIKCSCICSQVSQFVLLLYIYKFCATLFFIKYIKFFINFISLSNCKTFKIMVFALNLVVFGIRLLILQCNSFSNYFLDPPFLRCVLSFYFLVELFFRFMYQLSHSSFKF
jgi:hypothetical protein